MLHICLTLFKASLIFNKHQMRIWVTLSILERNTKLSVSCYWRTLLSRVGQSSISVNEDYRPENK